MRKNGKPELLIPAGSLEVLRVAVMFGADAVYIGGDAYGLRAKAKNFGLEDMAEGIRFAHDHGVKVHVTVNIFAHNYDIDGIRSYLRELAVLNPDALIIADPGVFVMAGELCPGIERHISTQANNTNYLTAAFWHDQGADRIVAARELSLAELREMRDMMPEDMELECFVHGAMCMAYSGRCLLSNYFTGRDANRGECTHPCRWRYIPRVPEAGGLFEEESRGTASEEHEAFAYITEETRPDEVLPVYENERGTYIFNSGDLCMIEHIPDLVKAGIDSYKIEGRMKTALYVATVARTYRKAIDDFFEDPALYRKNMPWYMDQIKDCTVRKFTTGFFYGKPSAEDQVYSDNTYTTNYVYLGTVEELEDGGSAVITQKNKFLRGDVLEIMKPDGRNVPAEVLEIRDDDGECMESAPHSKQRLHVRLSVCPDVYDILRISRSI